LQHLSYCGHSLPPQNGLPPHFLITSNRKGIASTQLAREIGVSQKTAWFMLGRLREVANSMTNCGGPLNGTVESNETYIGGKGSNKPCVKKN